ncbi:MAG: hypothetical protein ABS904_00005 [Solibacillus isronensis]
MSFEDILKRRNQTKQKSKETHNAIQLSADEGMAESELEYAESMNRAKEYMKEQGMVTREYFDEGSGEVKLGVFRKDDSVVPFDELWEATDIDLKNMSPQEQKELQEFWDRYQIEFKEPDPFAETDQFDDYFSKMKRGEG